MNHLTLLRDERDSWMQTKSNIGHLVRVAASEGRTKDTLVLGLAFRAAEVGWATSNEIYEEALKQEKLP